MREQKLRKIYLRELLGSIALYAATLIVALHFEAVMPAGPARTALLLSPCIPFLLIVWAIVRHTRRLDEYLRGATLEDLAVVTAITAGWTFTYGFLENVGFPRLSMFTIWPAMAGTWIVVRVVRGLRMP